MANRYSVATGLASSAATWDGGVSIPVEGDRVLITAGTVVTLDGNYVWGDDSTSTITINSVSTTNSITILGTLKASRSVSSSLTAKGAVYVNLTGWLDQGVESDPIPLGVTSTVYTNYSAVMGVNKYGFLVDNAGRHTMWGATKSRRQNLGSTASAGATSITLASAPSNWAVGDEIFFTSTDTTNNARYEYRTIAAGYTPGSTTVPLSAALTYAHTSGSPVVNITSNVSLKPYSTTHVTQYRWNTSSLTAAGSREFGYCTIDHCYSTYPYYGAAFSQTDNYTSNYYNNPYRKMEGIVVYTKVSGARALSWSAHQQATVVNFNNCAFIATDYSVSTDRGTYFTNCFSAGSLNLTNFVIANGVVWDGGVISPGSAQTWRISHGGISNSISNTKLYGSGNALSMQTTAQWSGLSTSRLDLSSMGSTAQLFAIQSCGSNVVATMSDVVMGPSQPVINLTSQKNLTDSAKILLVNKNSDATLQEEYTRYGQAIRNNSTTNRGVSSIAMSPSTASTDYSRSINVYAAAGEVVRVVGYIQYDSTYATSTYAAPVVSLGGTIGTTVISPSTFTASTGAAGTWQNFDLSVTNTAASGGLIQLTVTINSATITGKVYVDGIVDSPFIESVRHYGFTFDEANIKRVVNPYTVATESTAAAYTGVSINATAKTITVSGVGTANTLQKVYDYSQAWGCLNQSNQMPFSRAGTTLTTTSGWKVIDPVNDGTTWGGSVQLSTAGTKVFAATGASIEFASAGTYTLTGCDLSGTTTFSNTSGGSVTVNITPGTTYVNSGPNITVNESVTISAPNIIADSRVQIYNITDDVEIDNSDLSVDGYSFTLPYDGDKTIRMRAGYAIGASAKEPIESYGLLTSSGLTFLDAQVDDEVYNALAIDGGTCTEFTPDFPNLQIDVSDLDGYTTVQRIYSWSAWSQTSAQGIALMFGAVTAIDQVNFVINQDIVDAHLDNVTSTPVLITGGTITRKDGTTVIAATSGSIQLDPGRAYSIETGVSGLTPSESSQLASISGVAEAAAEAVVAASLSGSLTAGSLGAIVKETGARVISGL